MNRASVSSLHTPLITGSASIADDDVLTILAADDAFLGFFPAVPNTARNALLPLLPPETGRLLRKQFTDGIAQCEYQETFPRNGRSLLVHLSAVRIPGVQRHKHAVYHMVLTDLSELAAMRRATAQEKKKYDILADITADIPFEYDFATDTMIYAEKYRALFGLAPVIPRFRERLSNGESLGAISDSFRPEWAVMAVAPDKTPECHIHTTDGGRRWFSLFCTCLENDNGVPVKAVGALRDIDRQKREQLRLLDKSRIDAMTGLLNKATTEEEIRGALDDVRPGALGALMMIDIDNFKTVNDTLGHMAGDAVLAELARQLLRLFRNEDIIGRVGGDEFHIFMRRARDMAAVDDKAWEVCAAIRKHFLSNDIDNTVSVSVGVACIDSPLPYDELFRQADVALYRAKAKGKNRCEIFGREGRPDGAAHGGRSTLTSSVTRNSIVVDIIDTLFSERDMNQGIDKALNFMGNALNVASILIYEKSFDLKTVSITHEWTAQPEWSVRDQCVNVPVESAGLPRPPYPGGIFYCSDIPSLPPDQRPFAKDQAVTSLLQCDVMRDGMVVGLIRFEERGDRRIWAQQEIDALTLMARLISGPISQTQAVSLLRQNNEATRDILNSLPGAYVYVISMATHKLLYFNQRLGERFPQARLGMTCHELFKNSSTPCEDCVTRRLESSTSILVNESAFGPMSQLSVADILWENRESARVSLISEHVPTPEEREQRQKKEAYTQVLCDTFDYVLDIDRRTGRYELLALDEHALSSFPPQGDYAALHNTFADAYIHPDDRETFRARFDLTAMDTEFTAGAASREMEYRWRETGGATRWKNRIALPYRPADGSFHILTYTRDITHEKIKELRRREEEADYLLALQSNYTEIFRIDLETLRISPLYYNSEQVPIPPDAMDLAVFVHQRAHTRVHPDNYEAVMRYYAPERIRASIARNEITEQEYRKRQTEEGEYRRIAATFRPVPGHPRSALLLLRDVSRAREEEANFYAALKSSYTEIYEMDLDLDHVRFISRSGTLDLGELSFSYHADTRRIADTQVHPDDRAAFLAVYDPGNLRRRLHEKTQNALEYRLRGVDGTWHWLSTLVLPVPGADGCRILVLSRDITEEKRREEERNLEAQRFNLALRDTYTEIYEMDLESDTSALLVSNSDQLRPVGTDELADTGSIVAQALHPDDRQRIRNSFAGVNLRTRFEQGETEVVEEFRRLGVDGSYRWVSVALVPLRDGKGVCRKAMMLLKDVTQRKEQEQRQRVAEQYDRALRNIYDELYELNVTRDAYRIVYHTQGKYVTPPEQGKVGDAVDNVARHMIHPDDKARFLDFFNLDQVRASFAAGREFLVGEFRKLWLDGAWHWASLTMFPVAAAEGGDEVYLVFIMDIDARKKAEETARQKEALESQRLADERYRIIVEQTNTMVFEWCRANGTRYVSPDLPRRFAGRYDERDILQVWREDGVIHPDDLPLFDAFREAARPHSHPEMTVRFRTREGAFIWCKAALSCLCDEQGEPCRYIGTLNDVNDATRSVQALQYRAEYDTLTGVYNMQTFYVRAGRLIGEHPDRRYSIIRMDIDRFKVINDLYGMEEGDRLLKAIARMLTNRLTGHSVCGRLSGDIFCACVDYTQEETLRFVTYMTDRLAQYPLPSKVVPSFGICRVDNAATPISVLCDWANLALKTVKGNLLVSHAFYDETLRKRILDEKKIESEMHAALAQGQFRLYLQPKVYIPTSRIIGSEGLVRWVHPIEGIIPPDRFIPLFEKNGFIIQLDEFIWEQACITLRRWLDQGHTPAPISVNVSRVHIHDIRLCEKLAALIDRYRLPPHLLELELTESVFLDTDDLLVSTINTLQRHGFLLSLDDFGAGYSSLNMLKSLPIDIIKIDREFLNEVVATTRGKTVIRHTIAMARAMDMQVIAEGVETGEQAAFLLDAGCALAQGFLYARPVPVSDFEAVAFGSGTPFPVPGEVDELLQ